MKNVVIVGGGFGGVKTALELANKRGFRVKLITQTENFEYHGALYRSATGHSPLEVVIPLREIFARAKNVEVILDKVTRLDAKGRCVVGGDGTQYVYDKLVLALGNVVNYFGIDGMGEHTESMTTITQTIELRRHLIELFREHKEHLKIAIIGGGPSGVELAGELPKFASIMHERHRTLRHDLQITIVEGSDRLLPSLRLRTSQLAERRLRSLGVLLLLNTKVDACEEEKVCLPNGDLHADIIIWTAGSRASDFYGQYPDVFMLEKGKVAVDGYLHARGQSDIFVLGDNALTPYSGMAQTALYDAKFVADNLLRQAHRLKPRRYIPKHPIYALPVGPRWALVQFGHCTVSGYMGWLLRRLADFKVFKNFEPYRQAVKSWRAGNRLADF